MVQVLLDLTYAKSIGLGHKVICLDNLFTGSKNNISDLIDNSNFEFVNHDITEPYFRDNIDEIYNLACPASQFIMNIIQSKQSNLYNWSINMLGKK